ncbi:ankyrin repeat-containing domain protein [Trichophaea hybrida]|nr:ankyrin repeat-containing domain protein [Trichophaea hybrida]
MVRLSTAQIFLAVLLHLHVRNTDLIYNITRVIYARDGKGRAPLHIVCHPDVAKVLLDNGADVHATDVSGCTPLHPSAHGYSFQSDDITRVLFEHGADVNAKDLDGRTPLHGAIKKFRAVLLKYGADVQDLDNLEGEEDEENKSGIFQGLASWISGLNLNGFE